MSQMPISKQIQNYQVFFKKPLGGGGFGRVYIGFNTQKKQQVAVKVMQRTQHGIAESQRIYSVLNQIKIMNRLNSDNVVRVFNLLPSTNYYYITMQKCDDCLRNYIPKIKDINQAIHIIVDILNGYYQLIVMNIIHRDIKPQNILYKGNVFKLADFGLAKILSGPEQTQQMLNSSAGTKGYQSPEICFGKKYSRKCDIYSLGCVFYEIIFKRKLFYNYNIIERIKQIEQPDFEFPQVKSSQENKIQQKYKKISQKYCNVSQQYQRVSEEYKKTELEYRRISQQYKTIQQKYKKLSEQYKILQEYKKIQQEYKKIEQKYKPLQQSKDLIRKCLRLQQDDRINFLQLYTHKLFQNKKLKNLPRLLNSLKQIMQTLNESVLKNENNSKQIFGKMKEKYINYQMYLKLLKNIFKSKDQLTLDNIMFSFNKFKRNSQGHVYYKQFVNSVYYYVNLNQKQQREEILKYSSCSQNSIGEAILSLYISESDIKSRQVYHKLLTQLSKWDLKDVQEYFKSQDLSAKGLTFNFFKVFLNEDLKLNFNQDQCKLLFQKFDNNKDNSIQNKEFFQYIVNDLKTNTNKKKNIEKQTSMQQKVQQ